MCFAHSKRTHFTVMRRNFQPSFCRSARKHHLSLLYTMRYTLILKALTILFCSPLSASNLWKEDNIAKQIQKITDDKEIVWLETDDRQPTLALYKEPVITDIKGATIILHDIGHQPNWSQVIAPLRMQLPQNGWHTLSVQMPIPDRLWQFNSPEDIYSASINRLQAAITYLQTKNIKNLILIAQGDSAALASHYLSSSQHPFSAFVAISITHGADASDWRNISQSMKSLNLATLDIYAEHDRPNVLNSIPLRLAAARLFGDKMQKIPPIPHSKKVRELAKNKTNNLWFRQIMIPNAAPGFPDHQKSFVKFVRGWLKHYTQPPP